MLFFIFFICGNRSHEFLFGVYITAETNTSLDNICGGNTFRLNNTECFSMASDQTSLKLMTGRLIIWSKTSVRSDPVFIQGRSKGPTKMLQISYFHKQCFMAAGGMPASKVPLKAADASTEIKVKTKTKWHWRNAMRFSFSFFIFFLLQYDFQCLNCKG